MQLAARAIFGLVAMGLTFSWHPANRPEPELCMPFGFSFSGDWDCAGRFAGSGREHRSLYHGETSADGKWIDLTETDLTPKGYVGRYELGKDGKDGHVVFIDMNSSGYAIFDSPGWAGQTLTVTSTPVASYSSAVPRNRFIYTVQDGRHFDVAWQLEKNGAWTPSDELHCAAEVSRLVI